MGPKVKDLSGQRFGRLTVLRISHRNKHRDYFWQCQCECGTVKVLKADDFKNGETRSCGCLQLEITRAGDRILQDATNPKMLKPDAP